MRPWLIWIGLACSAVPALWPGDAERADGVWQGAVATAGADLTDPVYLDAVVALRRVSILQPAWPSARDRIQAVALARRRVLVHDRGGRRDAQDLPPPQ